MGDRLSKEEVMLGNKVVMFFSICMTSCMIKHTRQEVEVTEEEEGEDVRGYDVEKDG